MIPDKYVVINKSRLAFIANHEKVIPIKDRIKLTILCDLIDEGCTMNDVWLVFERYAIDYHVRQAIIEIKESINTRHELPDEISFVTLRTGEEPQIWDKYDRSNP